MNTAADHIGVTRDALAQLPGVDPSRPGKKVLIRADGAGGTKEFTHWLTRRGVQYSVGFTLPFNTPDLLAAIPADVWAPPYDDHGQVRDGADVWAPAYDDHGQVRDGAYVAELTDLLDLTFLAGGDAGHRPQRRTPTPVPSCGSPTPTANGSPRSRPTPFAGSWLTWSCATGAAPAAKTASPNQSGQSASPAEL